MLSHTSGSRQLSKKTFGCCKTQTSLHISLPTCISFCVPIKHSTVQSNCCLEDILYSKNEAACDEWCVQEILEYISSNESHCAWNSYLSSHELKYENSSHTIAMFLMPEFNFDVFPQIKLNNRHTHNQQNLCFAPSADVSEHVTSTEHRTAP